MIETKPSGMSFEEFLGWKPDAPGYELFRGQVMVTQPAGKHEEIIGFLNVELSLEVRRLQLPYFIPKQALVKVAGDNTSYCPDVVLVNREELAKEPLWDQVSTLTHGSSIPLVIEVVSTNWRTDYAYKLVDYEYLGICEYWVIDYLGSGGRRYIGSPKQPTLSIYQLIDEEYQLSQFRGEDIIQSGLFPDLTFTAQEIFNGGR